MDPANPRERLLAAAEEAFLLHGYGGANLGEIARQAGISKKTIYKFVASKSDLFAAVVSNAIAMEQLTRHLGEVLEGDVAAPLRAFLVAYARLSLSPRGAQADRLVTMEAQRFPELAKAYADSVEMAATQPLIAWLEGQARAGLIAITSADRAARMLAAMVILDPLKTLLLGQRGPFEITEIEQIVDEAIGIFLRGVQSQGEIAATVPSVGSAATRS